MNRLVISAKEFRQMFQSCCPPEGWGNVLAIAHSGGADSTCLLYLLHRLLLQQRGGPDHPPKLLSLSVDHDLQPGSLATAERCRQFSESLQVPCQILRIPWSSPPFPDRLEAGRPFESVARVARYRLFLEAMMNNHASVIAMGHHADDHVETLLMRLARSDSATNPTGMRNHRRWGMGTHCNSLDWAGLSGMNRWIVRPLLGVSKDRILATCELNELRYIDDPTNFQPSLTPRNFIRHYLSQPIRQPTCQDYGKQARTVVGDVSKVGLALSRLNTIATERSGLSEKTPLQERLRAAASYLSHSQDRVDNEVTQYLKDFTRPSPSSTLLLGPQLDPPTSEIRRALVLRILRFVSPRPWGAPGSEALRRSSSLRLICDRLWGFGQESRKTFCAGSEVVWRPVSFREDGGMRLDDGQKQRKMQGWLASRQPPIKRIGVPSPLVQDISELLNSHDVEELLWDNRFAVTLQPHLLPMEVLASCEATGSVMIVPHGRWLLPKIVWLRSGETDVIALGGVDVDVQAESAQFLDSTWVKFRWIRPLDVI